MTDVNEQLQELISNYMNSHPSLTLNAFAQRSDVSATTLRRIMSADNRNPPSPNTVLNIVSYINKEKRISILLNKTSGALGEFLRQSFNQFVFDNPAVVYDVDLNNILKDRENYLIYKLAANNSGVTLLEIVHLFGEVGRTKLKELIQKQIIVEDGKDVYRTKNSDFSLDIKTAKEHLPALVSFFKPEEAAFGQNLFYSLSESISDEAIQKIIEIEINAVKAIDTIMSDPKNSGKNPYFSIMLSDTLTMNSRGVMQ